MPLNVRTSFTELDARRRSSDKFESLFVIVPLKPVITVGVVVPDDAESLTVPFPDPVRVKSGDATVEVASVRFEIPET